MELTQGHPLKQLFFFALPLVFGTVFQQLYSFVDTVLVGRFLGTDALGAVGVTYSLNFLVMGFVQGLCVGFGIVLAQRFGAKDREGLRRFFWNGVYLCAGISLLLAVVTGGVGLLLVFRPWESVQVLTVLLGAALLAEGVLNLCVALSTVKIVKNQRPDVIETEYFEVREYR